MSGETDESRKSLDENLRKSLYSVIRNHELPYVDQKRRYGEGKLRIGQPVTLSEDIFSMAFISMLKDEYISLFVDVETSELVS